MHAIFELDWTIGKLQWKSVSYVVNRTARLPRAPRQNRKVECTQSTHRGAASNHTSRLQSWTLWGVIFRPSVPSRLTKWKLYSKKKYLFPIRRSKPPATTRTCGAPGLPRILSLQPRRYRVLVIDKYIQVTKTDEYTNGHQRYPTSATDWSWVKFAILDEFVVLLPSTSGNATCTHHGDLVRGDDQKNGVAHDHSKHRCRLSVLKLTHVGISPQLVTLRCKRWIL